MANWKDEHHKLVERFQVPIDVDCISSRNSRKLEKGILLRNSAVSNTNGWHSISDNPQI